MKIEFFHDVICSFCFPMSARMRKLAEEYEGLEIWHRSFALGWEAEDFIRSFGSREAVKPEVLGHWAHANENDEAHRFNIEGMSRTDFNFPLSRQPLLAAKAAGLLGGEGAYWDVFDRIQHKLFVENKNIEELGVLEEAVQEAGLSLTDWKAQYAKAETEEAVLSDLELARSYGVRSVPTLVINGKYAVPGALSRKELETLLERIAGEEGEVLGKAQPLQEEGGGASCSLTDGGWECD